MSLEEFRLNQPERRLTLVQELYEKHHSQNRDITQAKDGAKKLAFFNDFLKDFVPRRAAQGATGLREQIWGAGAEL